MREKEREREREREGGGEEREIDHHCFMYVIVHVYLVVTQSSGGCTLCQIHEADSRLESVDSELWISHP